MSINNITRNDTIDEWRIQTNQSANALNTIESGDYTKTGGTLFVNGASRIVITSSGTPLEVANAVLFQSSLTVGNTITLGVGTGQGNLSVGGSTTVYGNLIASGIGNSLVVANNATVGKNLTVTNTITGDNVTIANSATIGGVVTLTNSGNTFYVNSGSANIQTIYASQQYVNNSQANTLAILKYLDVTQNVTMGNTLTVTGNTTVGNLNTDGVTNTQTLVVDTTGAIGTSLTVGTTLNVTGNTTVGNLNTDGVTNTQTLVVDTTGAIGTSLTVGTTLNVTGNTTVGNLNTDGVTNTQSLVVDTTGAIGTSLTVGTTLNVTGNSTVGNLNTDGVTNTQTLVVDTTGAIGTSLTVGTTLTVTGNATVGNLNTAGVANSQTLRVVGAGTIGSTLDVTGNVSGANFNTIGAANAHTLKVNTAGTIGTTLDVTGNTTVGNLNTSGVANSQTLRVVGAGTIGSTLDVTSNVSGANFNTIGAANAHTLKVNTTATIGTTLIVTGNTTVGNLNTGGVANSQTLTVVTTGAIGTSLTVGTTLAVTGNATVGNLNTSGVANSQTLRVVGAGTIGSTLDVTGNVSAAHFNTSGTANAAALRITTIATITGNVTAGNLNTTNTVSAGALVTTGRADIGGVLTAGATTLSSGSVTGNFTVGGSFTIQGATLLDTNTITLSANTPTFGSGFAYVSINRGEGVTPANANAHIRWNESVKYWDIRDVDNPTSYSKILTANLISDSLTSTSSSTVASSAAANNLNTRINSLNTFSIAENTSSNLWLTSTRVRNNISSTTGFAGYNSTTGVITIPGTTAHVIEDGTGNIWLTAARVRNNISSTTGFAGYASGTGVITIPGTTAHIIESTANIWLTAARVRANVSNTAPINYDSSTGVFSHATSGVSATGYGDSISVPTFVVNSFGLITTAANVTIRSATTGQTGVVQLTDSVASTSTTTAATPNSVKTAYDLAATKFNSSGGTIGGDVVVTGNLTISGNTTYANTQNLLIGDNILTLNADLPAASSPSENAGIEVNRGNSTNVYIRWDETLDAWVANNGFSGSEYRLANTTTYLTEGTNLYLTSARVRANVSNTTPINYDSSTGVFSHATSGVSATGYGDSVTIPVFTVNTTGHVTAVTNTAVRSGTTGQTGVVQLTDSISSTSTTTAATPNSVKTAYDLANGKVSSVGASAPIASSGGATPTISLNASGVTATGYGDSISVPAFTVNTYGLVTAVTNTSIRSGSTSVTGIVQLTDSVASTSTTTAATPNSVKTAYDLANGKVSSVGASAPIASSGGATPTISLNASGVTATGYGDSVSIPVFTVNTYGLVTAVTNTSIRAATTSQTGVVQLTDSISSTSTTTAATPNSVKTAYDLAAGKISSVTITNGTGISGGGTGSSFTLSIGQDVATTANVQFRTIGVGTAADSANAGSIRATGDITAFYSDERLKENIVTITDALNKVNSIKGVYYTPNDIAVSYGYNKDKKVGVIAQDIEKVLPEIVVPAPFDIDENGNSKSGFNYKTVQYDKLVPLLIEAIKELTVKVDDLQKQINKEK